MINLGKAAIGGNHAGLEELGNRLDDARPADARGRERGVEQFVALAACGVRRRSSFGRGSPVASAQSRKLSIHSSSPISW